MINMCRRYDSGCNFKLVHVLHRKRSPHCLCCSISGMVDCSDIRSCYYSGDVVHESGLAPCLLRGTSGFCHRTVGHVMELLLEQDAPLHISIQLGPAVA